MIRSLWGRLVTLARPDKADFRPAVDFDPDTGVLDVLLQAVVRGERVTLTRGDIERGVGRIGPRTFRLQAAQVESFRQGIGPLEWADRSHLRCAGERVPDCLDSLRASGPLRESVRSRGVSRAEAHLAVTIDTDTTGALRFQAEARTIDGTRLPVDPAMVNQPRIHRKGSQFFRIPPWPQDVPSPGRTGGLDPAADPEAVRQFAEVGLARMKAQAEVQVSSAADALLASAKNPVTSTLRPSVDFAQSDGTLTVTLTEESPLGARPAPPLSGLSQPHFVNGQFVELDPASKSVAQRLKGLVQESPDGSLRVTGGNVPSAFELLRAEAECTLSPAAAAVRVHPTAPEQRTYLELEDADTLLVTQNLTTSDDRVILPPDSPDAQWPKWIRIQSEFFPSPGRKVPTPKRGQMVRPGTYRLQGDDVPDFVDADLPDLQRSGRVLVTPEAREIRVVTAAPEVRTQIDIDSAANRVVVRPTYRSGAADLPHGEITQQDRRRRYLRKGPTFHRLDWKLVDQVAEAAQHAGLDPQPDGTFAAPTLNVAEIINTFSRLGILAESEVFQRFRERLLGFMAIEQAPLPSTLRTDITLRDYQRGGYDWLAFLKNYGLPGILADEMGLGKTLQTLLAVAHFKDRYGPCPSLVVCPAALVDKWVDETAKFFRGLRAITHAGQRRREQLRDNIGTADVVAVSYDTLVRDADFLARWRWRFVIADEAQRVKNPGTKRARSIKQIPAEARIAITGTPVENRLLDLWAIFDFLATGYMGPEASFEREIAEPIERRGSQAALQLLTRKTRPFILRRLKKQVASELPDKLPKPLRCDLTDEQRALYRAVLERDFEAAVVAAGERGTKLSLGNPHIFAVLTKLKQICCHPGIVTGNFRPYQSGISGKFDTFIEVLEEILEAGQTDGVPNKLVAFSQFVPMATYLHGYIQSLRKTATLIDGSVAPSLRPRLCRDFNQTPDHFGMVLTLGSGGVGLDLQTANYVVMYDRWWNPAVEDQAIDRTHRLGQERQVVVVTITTRGTLEEKIDAKLDRRRGLQDQVIQADELMRKALTRSELLELVRLD